MLFLSKRVKHDFLDCCAQIDHGSLTLKTPEGEVLRFGQGDPHADMEIRDWGVVTALAARGDIGLGEAYVAGLWDSSNVEALIQMAIKNMDKFGDFAFPGPWQGMKFRLIDRVMRANSPTGASRNIRAHYDVGNEFYQLWLDRGMTYSSALFDRPGLSLQDAQARKNDRVLDRLSDGETVLEIGCGWGGFAEAAADRGHDVTGITLSPSQKGYADARLDGRAKIELRDYRSQTGTFDNIVSIEMIEAVGEKYWPSYFQTVKARLAETGTAMIQAITVSDDYFPTYRKTSDYIRQHTFPGGMLLSDGVIARQAAQAGLQVAGSHAFGQDYAQTCRIWAEKLREAAPKVNKLGYGEGFLRSWLYYLDICAASFAIGQTDVVQVELRHA
jgi:cyclopropane-fatty-acyl-phospholipid synthase